MNRPGKVVCAIALGLALSYSIASCGTSDGGSTPGKFLEIVNNTSVTVTVTVTVQSCPSSAPDPQQCATAVRIPPNGSADFPLSSPGSARRIVMIRGYAGQACLPIPTTRMREDAIADVTQVTQAGSGLCPGPAGGSPVALSQHRPAARLDQRADRRARQARCQLTPAGSLPTRGGKGRAPQSG